MKSNRARYCRSIQLLHLVSIFLYCAFIVILLSSCGYSREDDVDASVSRGPLPLESQGVPLNTSEADIEALPQGMENPMSSAPSPQAIPEIPEPSDECSETPPSIVLPSSPNQQPGLKNQEITSENLENEIPMGDWALILVNSTHPIPEDFSVVLADFESGKVDARIAETCKRMFDHARRDGHPLQLVVAHRTYEKQNQLFEKKVQSYLDKGYSRARAEAEAAKHTARPNTSEHQTGLALDIETTNTNAFPWLIEHAHEYGFILRYPEGKTDITGIIYEPWHWRFVGVEAARYIKESGQCLEEYLEEMNLTSP